MNFLTTNLEKIINLPNEKLSIIISKQNIPENVLQECSEISGYVEWSHFETMCPNLVKKYIQYQNRCIIYNYLYNIENQDVTQRLKEIKSLLVTQKQNKNSNINIVDTYNKFMEIILELSNIYSSFIEIVFTNMFIYQRLPIRYFLNQNPNIEPDTRLNYKQIHKIISKLLGLIYEPNSISISHFGEINNTLRLEADTIFEKLWKGNL